MISFDRESIRRIFNRRRLMCPIVFAISIPLALAATPEERAPFAGVLAAPVSSFVAYFPAVLQNARREAIPTAAFGTPVSTPVTPRPSSIPATATPRPTPESEHGEVVFQLATYGGLSIDMILGHHVPSQTPSFTLYEDGLYIRIVRVYDPDVDGYTVERVEGTLGDSERTELVRRLVEDVDFFDLPANVTSLACTTDLPDDYLYLQEGGREHRVEMYGLTSFTELWPCPATWPGKELATLVKIVDAFDAPLSDDEAPLFFDRISLVATERDDWGDEDPVPEWPFS